LILVSGDALYAISFGPGATIKAMAGQHFSFTVFAFTQLAIDLEPLYFMLRDEDPLDPPREN
jgi:hypothetical protein